MKVIEFPYFIGLPQAFTKMWRLIAAARRTAYESDICVLRGPGLLSMLVWAWLKLRRRPYAVEVLGDLEDVFAISQRPLSSWARRLVPGLVRRICRGAAAILYVSRVLESKYAPAPGAVRTVVSDVRMPEGLLRAARHFASPPKRLVLVHVGNMEQVYKGHDTMIRAVALCKQRGIDLELHFLGDGRLRGSFESLARELGVQDEVAFEGSVAWGPELFAHLDRSHLFLLPSLTEGVPKALIEAMARGLPVIASRVGGIPDLVDDDMLITPGDPELLADRVTALASDPDQLNDMARRCRENATRFTDERLSPLRHSFYTAVREIAGNSGSDVA
jgi:glycosyltransferase involved in cell wall biosynthesis